MSKHSIKATSLKQSDGHNFVTVTCECGTEAEVEVKQNWKVAASLWMDKHFADVLESKKAKKQKLIIKDKEATFVDTPDAEDEPQVEEPE